MLKQIGIILLLLFPFKHAMAQNEFITTWETTTADETITIPTEGAGYNYSVDWGDGTVQTGFTGHASHQYASPDLYTVKISGDFPRIYFNNSGDRRKIKTIEQWGNIAWESMAEAFEGCGNLIINATDAPNLSGVTSLEGMFRHTSLSTATGINTWDVSTITNMKRYQ